jgi:antagonist of KipI
VPLWQAVRVRAGQRLELGPSRGEARCYLCVQGGIDVPPVLGSAATHAGTGIGGFQGRALRAGDALAVGGAAAAAGEPAAHGVAPDIRRALYAPGPLRLTAGPQLDWFEGEALARLAATAWVVREASDRMGLRLDGPPLARAVPGDLLTEGVTPGAVQVPEDGRPILLGADAPTTGGYPKPAHIGAVDLHRLGQLRPRDAVRFVPVGLDEARRLAEDLAALLREAVR